MFGVNGWEIVLLALIAVFVLGPDKLPEYAAKLAQGIRKLRVMAEGAKGQLKDQLGPEYEDINWRQYDPRQYDPRRIVREALVEPLDEAFSPIRDEIGGVRDAAKFRGGSAGDAGGDGAEVDDVPEVTHLAPTPSVRDWDPSRPTPYDVDAT
ncbi:Sec-independent protein translocase subunit TatB [Oryzobacter telluris]|uniref:Sec-independent protein translocase subunit TatB n=1 Tax=Oryzobacter telluris TaxID=3149179 RepID=UPI00370D87B7